MTRIISYTQEKEIFKAVPASFAFESVTFTPSKKYPNQMTDEHNTFPVITLNFAQDGLPGPIRDVKDGVPYYQTLLTIHVLTKNAGSLSGAVIARGIMSGIIDEISTWTTPITGDIRIFDPEHDIHPVQNNGLVPDGRSIFDYILSVDIYHT